MAVHAASIGAVPILDVVSVPCMLAGVERGDSPWCVGGGVATQLASTPGLCLGKPNSGEAAWHFLACWPVGIGGIVPNRFLSCPDFQGRSLIGFPLFDSKMLVL